MRNFALILAIASLAGCTLLSDPDDTRGGEHALTINLHVKGPGGLPTSCPAGFQDLLLSANTGSDRGGTGHVEMLVPCATNGTATMHLYTSGERRFTMEGDPSTYGESFSESYGIVVTLTDPTGEVERATSLTTQVKLDHDQSIDVDIYPDAGIMLFSWELRSGITDAFVYSCPAVGLDEIELTYRRFTFEGEPEARSTKVRWPCAETHPPYYLNSYATGQGFVPALVPEDYVGTIIGYRNGVAVAQDESVSFHINTGNALTETQGTLTVPDR